MTSIRWAAAARGDLIEMADYYRPLNPRFADRLIEDAFRVARFLADHPRAGPVVGGDARKWTIRGSDYLLFYRIVPDGIEVLRVRSARANLWAG